MSNVDQQNDRLTIGSFRRITVPVIKFDSYALVIDPKGIPQVQGIGKHTESHIDNPKLFLELYRFGSKVFNQLHEESLWINPDQKYYQLAIQWTEMFGFPVKPEYQEDRNPDSEEVYTFEPLKFYLDIYVYRSIIDAAYKTNFSGKDESTRERLLGSLRFPPTEWGKMNIGERLEMMMKRGGGIYPYIELHKASDTFSVTMRANSHLAAACAQLAMSLVNNVAFTRECIECKNIFVPDGKEKTCSPICRTARRNRQCITSQHKPVEMKALQMRRTRKVVVDNGKRSDKQEQ